jgi:Mrp family chromosome partitioning ATPase
VTSCYRREGRTTVAAHLADVVSQGRRVLFLDANVPRPVVHRAMQEAARAGISLANGAAQTRQACAGASSASPARRVVAPPMLHETRDLLQSLCAQFDLVVVDLPPLCAAEALEWAPLLDGILLVAQSERVRWQVAAQGIAVLEQSGGRVLGAILNKRRNYIPHWLYRRL